MAGNSTDWNAVPWHQKRLNVMLIWLFLMPVGLVLLWKGDIYNSKKDEHGEFVKVKASEKAAITVASIALAFIFLSR